MHTVALKEVAEQVVLDRRWLHAHPELGFREHETARFIAERLGQLGLEVRSGVAETGVVGLLRGGRPGHTVLPRADLDAACLPLGTELPVRTVERYPAG